MKNPKKIIVIIQRSNGDVFLSTSLIKALYEYYESPHIDLLVNDDTYSIAKLIPLIKNIYTFSYQEKKNNRWEQEKHLIKHLFKKYDLSINLTASDRSVLYALIAGKKTISAVEVDNKKSWWKKKLLTQYYNFDKDKHILMNNLEPLNLLNIKHDNVQKPLDISSKVISRMREKLTSLGISDFIIFHPSAQYDYKIYPHNLRNKLIKSLSTLNIPIVITGSKTQIDIEIKATLPSSNNILDLIGETTLEELFALSELSSAYIGMDTMNMHIAASQNKRIFAIFGPTILKMWSPWSNTFQKSATENMPIQTYDKITIFQDSLPCVACGNAGCDDKHGKSECLYNIDPNLIFREIKNWHQNLNA